MIVRGLAALHRDTLAADFIAHLPPVRVYEIPLPPPAPKAKHAKQRRWRMRQVQSGRCPRCGDELGTYAWTCDRCHAARGGRQPGEHRRRLTPEKVVAIRVRYAGGESMLTLARAFGTSQANVYFILLGSTWKTVGGPRMVPHERR